MDGSTSIIKTNAKSPKRPKIFLWSFFIQLSYTLLHNKGIIMKILHTEASPGWGGQEIRILREAKGMRERGHKVTMAIMNNGGLVAEARKAGFTVYELPFHKLKLPLCLIQLIKIIKRHDIDIINTHSSLDAWTAGIAGRIKNRKIIRTRHLSTPNRPGINSICLYRGLADHVITTCKIAADRIKKEAGLTDSRCCSIPTGISPEQLSVTGKEVIDFRENLGLSPKDCLVGTTCILRSWKGVSDLLHAAHKLRNTPNLKWLIVGNGISEAWFRQQWKELGLEQTVIFTGYLSRPWVAIAAMDIFMLLSTGHEGVSQASLQAAYLKKPLITTNIGGLGEVCINGKTGLLVPTHDPEAVAINTMKLYNSPKLRKEMGDLAHRLALEKFTIKKTLDETEAIYKNLLHTSCDNAEA